MSKKLLRAISDKTEAQAKLFNKSSDVKAKYGGMKVAKLKIEDKEAYEKAVADGDINKATELLDLGLITPTELYFKMPDLKVSDSGSIRSLSVYAYSAEANDEVLLHKLFSKVREQNQPQEQGTTTPQQT